MTNITNNIKIGTPMKVRMNSNNPNKPTSISYGRFYGNGYDGEASPEDEKYQNIIAIATPEGDLIRGYDVHFDRITSEEDLKELQYREKLVKDPYAPYLYGEDDFYFKTYEYKNTQELTTTLHPPKWYESEGYLDIDRDIFGEGLSLVFMYNMDYPCYYNKVYFKYEGKSVSQINYNDRSDSRYIYVISPRQYKESIIRNFSEEGYPYRKRDENDSMFQQKPLSFIDEAFILRFTPCCKKQENIRLGKIVDGKFEPAHISPFDSWEGHKEVRYEHFEHSFIQEFMERIFEYKLANRKPNITMDDMYEILESYGFSRKNEMTRLARVLKRAEEKAMNDYKSSTSVADAYKK